MKDIAIINTTLENITDFGVCGYKSLKKEGFPEKLEWLKERFKEGLVIKTLFSQEHGSQGMIEYIPGKFCWRPVDAVGYMFIHCLFVGFKKIYKNQGYASLLLNECEADALKLKLNGMAVVTRKGSFMAGNEIFLKAGFAPVAAVKPDFELLVKNFNPNAPLPSFKVTDHPDTSKYAKGLFIIRAPQCPYTVKNVREITETAKKEFGITAKVVDLKNHLEAQQSPCPFGIFCMIYNGEIVAHHPISKGRFVNIMNKINQQRCE